MWKVEALDSYDKLWFCIDREYADEHGHASRKECGSDAEYKAAREMYCRPEANNDNLDHGAAVTLCDMLNMERYGRLDASND